MVIDVTWCAAVDFLALKVIAVQIKQFCFNERKIKTPYPVKLQWKSFDVAFEKSGDFISLFSTCLYKPIKQ